jgi:hypothetical protein
VLSENAPPACPVIWRFKGPSHGYAFKSTEGTSVMLTIGEQQARVTVEACLSDGTRTGGCASLTLTAAILDQAQDVAAYQQINFKDYTDPQFLCAAINNDQYQYVFYDVASQRGGDALCL